MTGEGLSYKIHTAGNKQWYTAVMKSLIDAGGETEAAVPEEPSPAVSVCLPQNNTHLATVH